MSTAFGIIDTEGCEIILATRHSLGKGRVFITWVDTQTEAICALIPDDTKIMALDNSPQGIETFGDIRLAIKEQEIWEEINKKR